MFREAEIFNQNLSSWDVSSATDMTQMFSGADDLSDTNKGLIYSTFSSNENWPHDWSEFVNVVPVFTSSDTVDAAENQTTAATVVATDADVGDTLSYTLTGGADQALFELASATGALTF